MINRTVDDNDVYRDPAIFTPNPRVDGGAPAVPAPPTEVPAAPAPGPEPSPGAGQDGPPPAAQQPGPPPQAAAPPAIVSAVPGVAESKDTGGVQGSFAQAGNREFTQKFGGSAPAVWFRNMLRGAATGGGGVPQLSRQAASRAGGMSGGAIPSVSAIPTGPSTGDVGGGPQDEEWQRFMQAVLAQRFGRG